MVYISIKFILKNFTNYSIIIDCIKNMSVSKNSNIIMDYNNFFLKFMDTGNKNP